MNTDAPWPTLDEARARVLGIQAKLHRWATDSPNRRFDDLYNLVADPAFLTVGWDRVRRNRGAWTAGVDGVAPRTIVGDEEAFLRRLRADLKAGRFRPLPVRQRMIPKANGRLRTLGIPTARDRTMQASLKLVLEPIFEAGCAPRGAVVPGQVKDLPGLLSQQGPEAGGSPSLEVQARVGAAPTT